MMSLRVLRRAGSLVTSLHKLGAAAQKVAARRWQSHDLMTSTVYRATATPAPDLRYENFYERLLKLYSSEEGGRVSVSKFLEVRVDVKAAVNIRSMKIIRIM